MALPTRFALLARARRTMDQMPGALGPPPRRDAGPPYPHERADLRCPGRICGEQRVAIADVDVRRLDARPLGAGEQRELAAGGESGGVKRGAGDEQLRPLPGDEIAPHGGDGAAAVRPKHESSSGSPR